MRSRKTLLNITSNLLLQIIIVLYGFIVPKIIINLFGSNVNGLISSITQFLSYIILFESGFGPVLKSILYKPIAKKDKNTIESILKTSEMFFRKISMLFLIYIFILCFLYPIFINNEFELFYTISLIIIIGISSFAEYYFGMTYKLYLQAEQKNYIISIIQIITYILAIISILVMAKLNCSIHIIKLISGLIFVIRPLLQNMYVKRKYNISFKNKENYVIKQKWDGLAQHIAGVIHVNSDITILTIFNSLIDVSIYSVYYLVVRGIKSIIQAFTNGIDAIFGDMIVKNEKENLKRKFSMYETVYNSIITIIYSCALVLIVPFVSVYTKNIIDANYIQPLFGFVLVLSELVWAIRLPYTSITYSAGHFKETKIGAWIECFTNIIISVLLVTQFGLVGVAFGTLIAMTIRTIEFVYHTNRYILDRSIIDNIKKIIIIAIETSLIIAISNSVPMILNNSYLNLAFNALMVFVISIIVTIGINYLFFKQDYVEFINIIKNSIKRKKENK